MADWAAFAAAVLDGLQGQDTAVLTAAAVADLFEGTGEYVAGWSRVEIEGQTGWAPTTAATPARTPGRSCSSGGTRR